MGGHVRFCACGLVLCVLSGVAHAGAWPIDPGRTQAILKWEDQRAGEAFDETGASAPIPRQRDDMVSVFFEHGLTSRLTLQGKVSVVNGEAFGRSYSGRGPIELGLRGVLWRGRSAVVSLYVGGVVAGAGQNAFYAPPGAGQGDVEVRLLVGDSGALFHRHVFEDIEFARVQRRELPDEFRLDTTVGMDLTPRWSVMVQSYSGLAQAQGPDPRWLKAEVSVVRRIGGVRIQAGWRQALAGREAPREAGPVLALWKTF